MTQQILGVYPREVKTCPHENLYMSVQGVMNYTGLKKCKLSKCLSTDEWINTCGIWVR